ncbi:chromosomal replication initiator protein DnaA [Methylacidimicrobium tartarophylax]|uniref:Chromosomal replication initiator protein DnaA n=1 Tax=Methylacidimicrobium tartarophylax TaxID=1041768 RepID=A0A5E6M645_9BACT|nr:chromosomal replication initiator protein DnaA [Methylacidimicrobium tartarophylax]VVM04826.1 Chromosomal replication initiator protein DnaA [Methylacidimicrobium tartarophylax]
MNNTSAEFGWIWEKVCQEMQTTASRDAVERWFCPLRILALSEEQITLEAPDSIYRYWIEENYLPQLSSALAKILGRQVRVVFPAAPSGTHAAAAEQPRKAEKPELRTNGASETVSSNGLNPRYTFDSFIVGANSEFADAAAHAVANAPARAYNPVFFYGKVGLGKTHLMQAIGNGIHRLHRSLKVQYVTCEQFTNEFIDAIQKGALLRFRRKYREVDVLLLDDVQFLAGKERSQEEFFHTFNCLFDGSKQIVLTSDAVPSAMQTLEKRLTSRFEWGLTAELLPPQLETRLAILRHKMRILSISVPDEILSTIAERIQSNVRQLEGALNRVAAFAALHPERLTAGQVQLLLKDLFNKHSTHSVTIESIQKQVAETFDIRLADMTSKRRLAHITLPRMVAMYLSRKFTTCSLAEIGENFGGRDHGTVLHAQRVVAEKLQSESRFETVVRELIEKLENPE